jgi:hypothetical protein
VVSCHGASHLDDGTLGGWVEETWVTTEHLLRVSGKTSECSWGLGELTTAN